MTCDMLRKMPVTQGERRWPVTKPIGEMAREELIGDRGYAASARRSFDAGNDPWPTLGRIKSMIERYKELRQHD